MSAFALLLGDERTRKERPLTSRFDPLRRDIDSTIEIQSRRFLAGHALKIFFNDDNVAGGGGRLLKHFQWAVNHTSHSRNAPCHGRKASSSRRRVWQFTYLDHLLRPRFDSHCVEIQVRIR